MNNNNLYNNNTFIGITHQDYFKTASNALATQIYITSNTLEGHLSNTSNILENHLYTTSNILDSKASNFTTTTSNLILARYDPLIREETEHIILPLPADLKHTYIYNSNLLGEIRFWCKSTSGFPVAIPIGVPNYRVKIDIDGKLKVYYTYDPFISATITNSWIDVSTSLISLVASDINTGIALAGLEAQIQNNMVTVQEQFAALFCNLYEDDVINGAARDRLEADTAAILASSSVTTTTGTLEQLYTYLSAFYRTQRLSRLSQAVNLINLRITQNAAAAFFLGIGGVVLSFIYSISQSKSHNDYISTVLNGKISSNLNFTTEQKRELYESNALSITSNMMDQLENWSNINVGQGFINTHITTQQYIPSIKTEAIYVNSGNINGIDINNLKTSGNIIENGLSLSSKYITSNQIYNLSNNYSAERQYPPKLYNNTQLEDTSLLKEILRFHSSLYLNNLTISYGSGYYDIFSSSTYDSFINSKDNLFNFNTADTTPRARFANSLYNSGTGSYVGNDTLDGSYYGDFVVLKMPQQISLTRYRIYNFTDTPTKGPSLWKVYGSNDGNTFTEITTASQTTRLTSYTNNYYEKTLTGISSLYSYIAFVFSALLSVSGQTELSFAELQIFGKELLNQSIVSNIYTTSNIAKNLIIYDTPQVAKHFGFYITITTAININGTTYYKYDIDLRKYTQLGTIQIGAQSGDTFRSFKIRVMYGTMFFSYIINDLPNVCYYEVFLSYKNTAAPPNGAAGLNACAIGFPPNTTLQTIMPNNLFIIKNGAGSIDYITVVSTNVADCRVILEDMLG